MLKKSEAVRVVQEALDRKGWRQKDLSERAKLSRPTVSQVLSGNMLMSRRVAEALAEALGLAKDNLVELATMDRVRQMVEEYEDYPEVQARLEHCISM